ncbi:uncharacterized protein LOC108248989 [Kryptolebias marmoratus]|uniref:Uncharacterized LOC108248989 n=1 Tax=Kryptolebias marmoratus TaxID=37003 RepID=A0A3Q3BAC7_KRYMA|nr:uncharacterized protein LOC108248989 [Kryptolebias marmoratus]XP_037836606.1 uncharacterized protein LOC108248989 [Kryptolebias marmoratus]
MTIYLLLPALVLGSVASQSAGTTERRLDDVLNQTFTVFPTKHSPTEPNNQTSFLHRDETAEPEELNWNRSSAVITEDDESFQEQESEFPHRLCRRDLLVPLRNIYCGEPFHAEMQKIPPEDRCVLENVIRPYNDLTVCLEILTSQIECYYPNPDTEDFFLDIHSSYFHNCTEEEEAQAEDAPTSLVVALTIIPVSFIPVLVYLSVRKS